MKVFVRREVKIVVWFIFQMFAHLKTKNLFYTAFRLSWKDRRAVACAGQGNLKFLVDYPCSSGWYQFFLSTVLYNIFSGYLSTVCQLWIKKASLPLIFWRDEVELRSVCLTHGFVWDLNPDFLNRKSVNVCGNQILKTQKLEQLYDALPLPWVVVFFLSIPRSNTKPSHMTWTYSFKPWWILLLLCQKVHYKLILSARCPLSCVFLHWPW